MITEILTIQEIKEFVSEILLNKTSKVSKISDDSVLNGLMYGVSKTTQKAIKDIALIESHLFPEYAYGENLDIIARRQGISERYGASKSSTYVRLVGSLGTFYQASTNILKSTNGISFQLENDVTIDSFGYAYAKVQSADIGIKTNVDPLTITKINPQPTGHQYVINEYQAIGGRDIEQDDVFRQRIQEAPNYVASSTISKLTQIFMKINNDVLRVIYGGNDSTGKLILYIVTQNGIDLSDTELDDILVKGQEYLSITEQRIFGLQTLGIVLKNIAYQPIDIDFRVELFNNINPDTWRIDVQTKLSKYFDFRFWDSFTKVQYDDLLLIVKTAKGTKYVTDSYFTPHTDFYIDNGKLPRVRSFIVRSLDGTIIQNITGTLNPVYFTNQPNNDFSTTILSTI